MPKRPSIPRSLTHGPTIQVRQEHIDYGKRNNSCRCPLALAIRSHFPTAAFISVDLQTIRYSLPETGYRFIWLNPPKGQRFLADYEGGRGGELKPFKMTLRGLQLINIQHRVERVAQRAKARAEKLIIAAKRKSNASVDGRSFAPSSRDKKFNIPPVIGGRPPPIVRTDRIFGVRAWN